MQVQHDLGGRPAAPQERSVYLGSRPRSMESLRLVMTIAMARQDSHGSSGLPAYTVVLQLERSGAIAGQCSALYGPCR